MPWGIKYSECNPISLNAAGAPYFSKICGDTVDYHCLLKTPRISEALGSHIHGHIPAIIHRSFPRAGRTGKQASTRTHTRVQAQHAATC